MTATLLRRLLDTTKSLGASAATRYRYVWRRRAVGLAVSAGLAALTIKSQVDPPSSQSDAQQSWLTVGIGAALLVAWFEACEHGWSESPRAPAQLPVAHRRVRRSIRTHRTCVPVAAAALLTYLIISATTADGLSLLAPAAAFAGLLAKPARRTRATATKAYRSVDTLLRKDDPITPDEFLDAWLAGMGGLECGAGRDWWATSILHPETLASLKVAYEQKATALDDILRAQLTAQMNALHRCRLLDDSPA